MPQKLFGLIFLFPTLFIPKTNPSGLNYPVNLDKPDCLALTGVDG